MMSNSTPPRVYKADKKISEKAMTRISTLAAVLVLVAPFSWSDDYLGNYSANPYNPNSTSNPNGAGSPYNSKSINNPYGTYGSPYSPKSATNPYATDAPKLRDSQGNYRGRLSSNPRKVKRSNSEPPPLRAAGRLISASHEHGFAGVRRRHLLGYH